MVSLDYTLQTSEERKAYVEKILAADPKAEWTPADLEHMADYLVFCMDKEERKSKKILKEMSSFFGARLLTLGMEMGILWFFITFLKLDTPLLTKVWTIVTQVLILTLNYVFSKLFVFKKEK